MLALYIHNDISLYDTVMFSLDNEFRLMFSDEQFHGNNKYD